MKSQLTNPQTHPGVRKGFVLAVAGGCLLLLLALLFPRSKPTALTPKPPPQNAAVPAPHAKQAVIARVAPPAEPQVKPTQLPAKIPTATLVEKLGLEVVSVRLTAAGRALDVRYRVVDPQKAAALDTPDNTAYLVDQATGTRIGTPQPPPPLELHKPAGGRIYGVLFANAGGLLKSGSKVTLVVGQAHAKDLTVE